MKIKELRKQLDLLDPKYDDCEVCISDPNSSGILYYASHKLKIEFCDKNGYATDEEDGEVVIVL